jgi:hypothetical protein
LELDVEHDQEDLEKLKEELKQGILAWAREKKRNEHVMRVRDIVMKETVRDDYGVIQSHIETVNARANNIDNIAKPNRQEFNPLVNIKVEIGRTVPDSVANEIMEEMDQEREIIHSILETVKVERVEIN